MIDGHNKIPSIINFRSDIFSGISWVGIQLFEFISQLPVFRYNNLWPDEKIFSIGISQQKPRFCLSYTIYVFFELLF